MANDDATENTDEQAAAKPVKKKRTVKKAAKKKTATKKVAEKLKDMGVMPSETAKTENKVEAVQVPPVIHFPWALYIVVAVVAFGLVGIYIYKHSSEDERYANQSPAQQWQQANAGNYGVPAGDAYDNNMPEWVKERRAQMQKRMQKNTPDWVKEQRSQMNEKMARPNRENRDEWSSEPPPWIKERLAQRQQWMKQQQSEWDNPPQWNPPQPVAPVYNGPAYYYPPHTHPVYPNYGYGPNYVPTN